MPRVSIAGRLDTKPHAQPAETAERPMSLRQLRKRTRRMTLGEKINAESAVGSLIFGPVPEGHRREFFHDQNNIWIWHEAWTDMAGKTRQLTIRYEVRTTGVYKKVSAGQYYRLEGEELANFRKATHAYLKAIKEKLYKI